MAREVREEVAMPMLWVHCVKCKRNIPTGLDVDYDTFQSLTHTERTLECPLCDELQVWNLDDVDKSVFKKT
jgi:hypothetical protein